MKYTVSAFECYPCGVTFQVRAIGELPPICVAHCPVCPTECELRASWVEDDEKPDEKAVKA